MAARDVPHCTSVPGLPFHVRPVASRSRRGLGLDQREALATPKVTARRFK